MHPHQRAQMEIDFDPDAGSSPPTNDAGAPADAGTDSAPIAGTFVDQYNGAAAGGFVVSMSTHVTQTITAGVTGQLTLVEIGVGRVTATNGQRLRLNVRDGAALLGSAILPASSLPQGYGYNVQFGSRGPGLFDLRASNIRVTAGQTYQLELEGLDIIDTGTCVRGLCSNDPNTVCTASDECTRYAEFGVTVSTANPYSGGAVTATGPFGTLVRPDVDFTFATIVQTP